MSPEVKPLANRRGFTLIETIIALAIMTLAFAAILDVESESINAAARTRQMNIVAMLAKNIMVETEYKFEGKTFDEYKKEDGGQFEAPYEDFKWKTEIKEIEFPNIGASSAQTGADQAGGDITETFTKLVTNFLSKAIREVVVTITWKKGRGEQNFTVSTYWVDLNHEFNLSE